MGSRSSFANPRKKAALGDARLAQVGGDLASSLVVDIKYRNRFVVFSLKLNSVT